MSRRRSVEDWRREVFKVSGVAPQTKLGLILMADHMAADRTYSRPRRSMADDLGVSERVVDKIIGNAHRAGLLDTVQRGQKGVTAVYQGLFPEAQREPLLRAEPAQNVRAEPAFSANHVVRTSSTPCGCNGWGCERCA